MTKNRASSNRPGPSIIRNLSAGDYGFIERLLKIAGNVGLKVSRRTGCCGHYGDPGC